MERRIFVLLLKRGCLLALLALLAACGRTNLAADNSADAKVPVINPEVERRDIGEANIDTSDFELGAYIGYMSVEDFGSNVVYGARLNYHITEHFFAQANYGQTDTDKTSFEELSGGANLLSDGDRTFTYYNALLGINLLPGESFIGSSWAFNSALYLVGGVGNVDFGGDDYFAVTLGAGYRILPVDFISINFDVRDHMFDSDILGDSKVTHNIEFLFGLNFFF
ncbi:MAG: outer membrane beta-barrel domain-containing protein [Gammaproteobacteria bacterium]|nr:MAG: outer membrane beta-barrel domain-containing protein [Gammaproteobacteria bacterium]